MDHVQEQTVRLAEGKFLAWAGGLDTWSELMSLLGYWWKKLVRQLVTSGDYETLEKMGL